MNARPLLPGFALVLLVLASSAYAQYIYLDSNGNGVHTASDKLHPVRPTVVDIWLDTAHNRDGSATSCHGNPATTLDMFSYVVNLKVSDGTVSYSSYTNRLPGYFPIGSVPASDETQFCTGLMAGSPNPGLPPGKYLLGTLTITVATGDPSVQIVPRLAPQFIDATSFGSHCEGGDNPNTITLGQDWFDVDGLDRPGH